MGFMRQESALYDEFGSPANSDNSTPSPSRSNKKPKKHIKKLKSDKVKSQQPIQKSPPNNTKETLGR